MSNCTSTAAESLTDSSWSASGSGERRNFGGRNVTFPARHVQRQRRAQVVRAAQANRRCGRAGSAAGRDPDCLSGVRGSQPVTIARELRIVYRGGGASAPFPHISKPADAAVLLRSLEHEPVEVCHLVLLSTKHPVIGTHELSRGTLDSCTVHPRDVFKAALLANAAGVIVAHNHPSGDPTPSRDDVALCQRLRSAAELDRRRPAGL